MHQDTMNLCATDAIFLGALHTKGHLESSTDDNVLGVQCRVPCHAWCDLDAGLAEISEDGQRCCAVDDSFRAQPQLCVS